ncbi:MAG TPA: hypothetical protein VJ866_02055 [Pyrinomonadaceae bacterium]|nr:hypothetical protein [Pyrinomonadaceae bacterium]
MATEIEKRKRAFQETITRLEKKRKSRIFCLVQNEHEHLCAPTFATLIGERNRFKDIDTLDILVHSGGGHIDVAYQAAKFFRRHCRKLNVLVPIYAKSAATLICLMADTIHMGEFAELGPLDVQIHDPFEKGQFPFSPLDEFKSMEFLREYASEVVHYFSHLVVDISGMSVKEAVHESLPAVIQMMAPLYKHVDPSKVGGYRRSLAVGEEYARRILQQRRFRDIEGLTQRLVWQYPSHDFVIDYDEVVEMGLPVKRLDLAEENQLLGAIFGILEYGGSAYGFIEAPTPARTKPKPKRVASKSRKRPVPVPAPTIKAVKSRTAA